MKQRRRLVKFRRFNGKAKPYRTVRRPSRKQQIDRCKRNAGGRATAPCPRCDFWKSRSRRPIER